MANTNITYRAVKGSALTYSEMDQNFASFFYSASTFTDENDFNKLRLHYTGSNSISGDFANDRYIDVTLPNLQGIESGAEVGGSDKQIQFNDDGNLAGDPEFLFDKTTNRVSIGLNTLDSTLTLRGTTTSAGTVVKLNSLNSNDNKSQSYIDISKASNTRLKIGLTSNGSTARPTIQASEAGGEFVGGLEIGQGSKTHLRLDTNGTTIGVAKQTTLAAPNKTLTVIGQMGIGNGATTSTQSTFLTLADGSFTGALTNYLPTSAGEAGLLITTPYSDITGGNIVVGINKASGANETFSIFSGANNIFNKAVATFKADGKIGFNQRNPKEILHVEGNITGSGDIHVGGTATVKTVAELAYFEPEDDWEGSDTEYARTLVKSSTGLVQYMDAAPVPKGGIIMWSGAVDNVPKGWRLCDGSAEENGIPIPDLRERFIVGAGGNNPNVTGEGYAAKATGGTTKVTRTASCKLGESNIPAHNHTPTPFAYGSDNRGQICEYKYLSSWVVGDLKASDVTYTVPGGGITPGSADYDTNGTEALRSATCAESLIRMKSSCIPKTEIQTYGKSADKQTAIDLGFSIDSLPPYYALAFIIYVGVA